MVSILQSRYHSIPYETLLVSDLFQRLEGNLFGIRQVVLTLWLIYKPLNCVQTKWFRSHLNSWSSGTAAYEVNPHSEFQIHFNTSQNSVIMFTHRDKAVGFMQPHMLKMNPKWSRWKNATVLGPKPFQIKTFHSNPNINISKYRWSDKESERVPDICYFISPQMCLPLLLAFCLFFFTHICSLLGTCYSKLF